jgi:hypothetical protein
MLPRFTQHRATSVALAVAVIVVSIILLIGTAVAAFGVVRSSGWLCNSDEKFHRLDLHPGAPAVSVGDCIKIADAATE